jgi:methylated-DNA-[protein]-cysteine S-methyltransferase
VRYAFHSTPIGRLLLAADAEGVRRIVFPTASGPVAPDPSWEPDGGGSGSDTGHRYLACVMEQLDAYFAGMLTVFDLPIAPAGTVFQQRVWTALRQIPYGSTVSYRDIARRLDQPNAVRAVGAANGANPLPIVIPCHRVIGADGSLVGFGGGLPVKTFLLTLEGALPAAGAAPGRLPFSPQR